MPRIHDSDRKPGNAAVKKEKKEKAKQFNKVEFKKLF